MEDMEDIVAVAAAISDLGSSSMVVNRARTQTPSYPNWQRKRIQNPASVSSSLTEGTTRRTPRRERDVGYVPVLT